MFAISGLDDVILYLIVTEKEFLKSFFQRCVHRKQG